MPGLQIQSLDRAHKKGNQLLFLSHTDVSLPLFHPLSPCPLKMNKNKMFKKYMMGEKLFIILENWKQLKYQTLKEMLNQSGLPYSKF